MTQTTVYEFSKLETIDLNVASWLNAKCPLRLYSYLEFIAETDYKRKGINLDFEKVFDELTGVYAFSGSIRATMNSSISIAYCI